MGRSGLVVMPCSSLVKCFPVLRRWWGTCFQHPFLLPTRSRRQPPAFSNATKTPFDACIIQGSRQGDGMDGRLNVVHLVLVDSSPGERRGARFKKPPSVLVHFCPPSRDTPLKVGSEAAQAAKRTEVQIREKDLSFSCSPGRKRRSRSGPPRRRRVPGV